MFLSLPGISLRSCRWLTLQHWKIQPVFPCAVFGNFITRIGVAHHPGTGIIPKYPANPFAGGIAAVTNDNDTGVLAKTHADTTAMVETHPCGTTSRV